MLRKIILFLFLGLISVYSHSQNALIEHYRNKIFYQGIDNPLKASLVGVDCDSFFLSTSNGIIIGDNCSYSYRPNKIGNTIIYFNQIKSEDTVVIERKEFRVKGLPSPTARVSGIINGDISRQRLIAQLGVATEIENFDINIYIKAKSYRTIILRGDDVIFNNINEGNRFSEITKKGLLKIQPGDIVYFISIISVYPNGIEIPTNSIELRVL